MMNSTTLDGILTYRYKTFDGVTSYRTAKHVLINPDDFLKIAETLTRIGIYAPGEMTLWQSCHILHKRGFYYIVHFKELFAMDGRVVDFTKEDEDRRDVIISLLLKWGLVKLANPILQKAHEELIVDPDHLPVKLRIIPFKSKRDFNLKAKYTIGEKN